jgi:GT2 family glycosyltransferase
MEEKSGTRRRIEADVREVCAGPGEPGLVSVIIPTYNRAYVLGDALRSVLAQTYRPLEVIVVDDGSTDNTEEVVRAFGDDVRYVRQENAGCPTARNVGFTLARGEFIALLDSDDRWLPWKIALQVAFMQRHPDVGMVWTGMSAVTDDGKRVADRHLRVAYRAWHGLRPGDIMQHAGTVGDLGVALPPRWAKESAWVGDIFAQLIRGNIVHTPTTLLRRERVHGTGGYDESLARGGEDFDFHLRTAVQGPVGFLDLPTMEYRIGNQDQLTADNPNMARAHLRTMDFWLGQGHPRLSLSRTDVRGLYAYAHQWVGTAELMTGGRQSARHHLWRSLRYRPASFGTLAALSLAILPPRALSTLRATRRMLRRGSGSHQGNTSAA